MLAEPSGNGSKEANNSSTGAPSSPSIICWASPAAMGLAVSWSLWSSESTPSGSMSERVERTCPNLTKVGPRSSRVRRNLLQTLLLPPVPPDVEDKAETMAHQNAADLGEAPEVPRPRSPGDPSIRHPRVFLLQSRRRFGSVAAFWRGLRFARRWRRRRGTVLEHPHPVLQLLDAEEEVLIVLPGRKSAPPETLLQRGVDQRTRPRRTLAGAVHHVVYDRAALFALDAPLLDERINDLLHPVPRRGSGTYLQQDQTLQRLANRSTHNYLQIIWCTTYMITKAHAVWPRGSAATWSVLPGASRHARPCRAKEPARL